MLLHSNPMGQLRPGLTQCTLGCFLSPEEEKPQETEKGPSLASLEDSYQRGLDQDAAGSSLQYIWLLRSLDYHVVIHVWESCFPPSRFSVSFLLTGHMFNPLCCPKGLAHGRCSRSSDFIDSRAPSPKITIQTKGSDISNMGHYDHDFIRIPGVSQQLAFRGDILSYDLQNCPPLPPEFNLGIRLLILVVG